MSAPNFRSVFNAISKDALHWFPGHMNKGLKQMQQKLRSVDCIIEVHDARIPLSGLNIEFKYKILGVKPHILVLNKVDMIDSKYIPVIQKRIQNQYPNVVFTNCKNHQDKGLKQLFPLAQELIKKSERYNRNTEDDYCVMLIGIPNVGKSSLTNCLRNRYLHKAGASAVGKAPGITRSVLTKIKMCEQPLFYMLDTPGILTPNVESIEVGLKLALCNTIQDHLVGTEIIADYLLYWLNKHQRFEYVKRLGMSEATDNILDILVHIAKTQNKMMRRRDVTGTYIIRPDINSASQIMIKMFRSLEFGRIMLDEDLL